MPRRSSPHPTEAELEILNVLWRQGPSSVRQIHEALQADRRTGLTTTLKLLQVMAGKGLVDPGDERPHRYAAAIAREKAQGGLLGDLVRKAFDGSVSKLMVRAVEDGKLSRDELQAIRKLIDTAQKGKRGGQ